MRALGIPLAETSARPDDGDGARRMLALSRFGEAVGAAPSPAELGRALHAALADLLDLAALTVRVLSPGRDALELAFSEPEARDGAAPIRSIPRAGAAPEALCAARRGEVEAPWPPPHAKAPGPGEALCLPLLSGGQLYGVLVVAVAGGLSADDRAMLGAFSTLAAIGFAMQQALQITTLLRDAIELSDEAVSFYDATGRILFTNAAYHRVFSHYPPRERLLRMTHEELYRLDLEHGVIDDSLARLDPQAYLEERLRLFRELQGESRELQTISGRTYIYVRTRATAGATLSRRIDITDIVLAEARLREAQQRLEELAYSDVLTGLANRVGFGARAVEHQRTGPAMSVLLLDLDRFKAINDTLGHAAGDALLRAMAKRLLRCVRPADVAARLGADEFAILLPGQGGAEARRVARRVLEALNAPYWIDDRRIVASVSVGLSSAPEDGDTAEQLLRNADRALDRAKAEGRATLRRYEARMDVELQERQAIGLELPEAMTYDEFQLYYQPVVALASGAVTGLEALLRWNHPVRGLISPSVFIPVAEDIGLMDALGEWVLRRVCADARHWPAHLSLAVNMSARQLASSGLVGVVESAIATGGGLSADRLEIEITESMRLQGNPAVLGNLHRLRDLGVRIALDDFGTGYSSLSYLCSFPFTKIKIDQSFVRGLADRADCTAIVSVAAELGRRLGMSTTAEGVETADQFTRLRDAGCTEAQGFLIAPPRPLQEMQEWLGRHLHGPPLSW